MFIMGFCWYLELMQERRYLACRENFSERLEEVSKMRKKVCACIVTFNPDMKLFSQCLVAIKKQVERVYVFDNGSKNVSELMENLTKDIKAIYSEQNLGIAKALNELCKVAEKDGFDWIITMDQDSICGDKMVETLLAHTDKERVGIIAPRVEFRSGGKLIHETKNKGRAVEEIRACITSGSLTKIEAWKKVGGFDEGMFIDHVDNEFCTHLVIEGFSILRDNNAVLYQRAGEMKYLTLPGGKKILLPYYSEFRNYYICRNTVYYIRKYRMDIDYRHEWMTFLYSQIVKVLFEGNRIGTIRSTIKGIRDGKREGKGDALH